MRLIEYLFKIYELIILARVFISWVHVDNDNRIVQWIYRLTEPVLAPFRKIFPMERIGLDFSPLLALVVLEIVQWMLFRMV